MKKVFSYLLVTGVLFTSSLSFAADFGKCNVLFPKQKPPSVSVKNTRELCFSDFAILYSVDSKTPVYTIEKLSYLRMGKKETRTNNFHEEPKLKSSERSTLKDYAKSGYDRGHQVPAGDMKDPLAMEESFSLANMVPQAPKNNRGIWAKNVEIATRKYVERSSGNVFVFTGGFYGTNHKTIGANKVWVPDYLWKLVYDDQTGKSWVFWIENSDTAKMSAPITYEEFVKRTGLNLLANK